jgi:hypothetical protein
LPTQTRKQRIKPPDNHSSSKLLKDLNINTSLPPSRLLFVIKKALRSGKIDSGSISVATRLIDESECILAYLDSGAQDYTTAINKWRTVPCDSINRWLPFRFIEYAVPLWQNISSTKQSSIYKVSSMQKTTKQTVLSGQEKKKMEQDSCLVLVIVYEKRCAAVSLLACVQQSSILSAQVIQIAEVTENVIADVVNDVTKLSSSTTQAQTTTTPIEKLETLVKRRFGDNDRPEILKLIQTAQHKHDAVLSVARWITASVDWRISGIYTEARNTCTCCLSVLARLVILGDSGSHITVARIAAVHRQFLCMTTALATPDTRNEIEEWYLDMIVSLRTAVYTATTLDEVMSELGMAPTNVADLWTAVNDTVSSAHEQLKTVGSLLLELSDALQALQYTPPPAAEFIAVTATSATETLEIDNNTLTSLFNFRQVIIDDCNSHGLIHIDTVCPAIKTEYKILVQRTAPNDNEGVQMKFTRQKMNDYVCDMLRLALFMCPVVSAARAVAVCSPFGEQL